MILGSCETTIYKARLLGTTALREFRVAEDSKRPHWALQEVPIVSTCRLIVLGVSCTGFPSAPFYRTVLDHTNYVMLYYLIFLYIML